MYNYVGDIPDEYELVTDSQDIEATLESIGMLEDIDEYGCLFVLVGDGEYEFVYGCSHSYPRVDDRVELIYDPNGEFAISPAQLELYAPCIEG